MPVYNSELYLREAVDSILNQTFSDFELLIIDDASTDQSVAIIQSYTDSRIHLIQKPENTGYTQSLNMGLAIAKGEFIARMDSDDISLPTRFEQQIAYLDAHPDVLLCGTQFQFIGSNWTSKQPLSYEELKVKLITASCILHPSVCFRTSFFRENNIFYDIQKEPAEDYDLWTRLIFMGKMVNLDTVLLQYRRHTNQVSTTRFLEQRKISNQIKFNMLCRLSVPLNINSILFKDDLVASISAIREAYDTIVLLELVNAKSEIYATTHFNSLLEEEKYRICKMVKHKNNLVFVPLVQLLMTRPKIFYYMIRFYLKKYFKK